MKTFKKLMPVIALVVMIAMLCSACSFSNVTSIFKKNNGSSAETTGSNDTTAASDGVSVDATGTDDYIVIPPEDSGNTGTATVAATTASGSKTNGGNTVAIKNSAASGRTNTVTAKKTATVKTASGKTTTKVDLSNMSVQEIQQLLFSTDDPGVAEQILTYCGFAYDPKQDIYYSNKDSLQRYFGFNILYDLAAPQFGMIYETARIKFDYKGKNWMVQLWKGQYGITAGGEVGLYNKPTSRNVEHYDSAEDSEFIDMQFDFYNNKKLVFSRGPQKHWWLTGFKVFSAGVSYLLNMNITLTMTDEEMSDAFEDGLKTTVEEKRSSGTAMSYTRSGNTFYIKW